LLLRGTWQSSAVEGLGAISRYPLQSTPKSVGFSLLSGLEILLIRIFLL